MYDRAAARRRSAHAIVTASNCSRAPPRDGLLDADVERRSWPPTEDVARSIDGEDGNRNVDGPPLGSPHRQLDAQLGFDLNDDFAEIATLAAADVEYPLFALIGGRQQEPVDDRRHRRSPGSPIH